MQKGKAQNRIEKPPIIRQRESDKEIIHRFNCGYLIAKYDPDLFDIIFQGEYFASYYGNVFIEGGMVYQSEKDVRKKIKANRITTTAR